MTPHQKHRAAIDAMNAAAERHTPGPWHLDGYNMAAVIHCTAEKGSPDAKHLCGDYETIARCEGDNWSANARMIASAPDLLEALREATLSLDGLAKGEGVFKPIEQTIKAGLAAIAKAEARSNSTGGSDE